MPNSPADGLQAWQAALPGTSQNSSSRLRQPRPRNLVRSMAVAACVFYGICLILNTQPLGDGAWFWYANALHHGAHLYSGLHLPLQPGYVLETQAAMALFGKGWLVLKIPALIHLLLFCTAAWLITTEMDWGDTSLAVLLAASFVLGTLFVAFRLDDYHVICDVCEMYSIYLLLRLGDGKVRRWAWSSAGLGILAGISATTRLNDGGALFAASAFCLVMMLRNKRAAAFGILLLSFGCTALVAILLTGDSLGAYLSTAVLHAAKNKGGSTHLLQYPFLLAIRCFAGLLRRPVAAHIIAGLFLMEGIALALQQLRGDAGTSRQKALRTAGAVVLIASGGFETVRNLWPMSLAGSVADFFCSAMYVWMIGYGVLLAVRLARTLRGSEEQQQEYGRHALLLLPLSQMFSASLSSAGYASGLGSPVGVAVLLIPLLWRRRAAPYFRTGFLVLLSIVIIGTVEFKISCPFSWHTYIEQPMFRDRVWFHHPAYGPMYVEKRQLAMAQQVCSEVRGSGSQELLSYPFPYANYFCEIPPWHGFAQMFYDTSSPAEIAQLHSDLAKSPPQWILYQHQPEILQLHERVYYGGKPLPHRGVEQMFLDKIKSGEWKLISDTPFNESLPDKADYMLIRTR